MTTRRSEDDVHDLTWDPERYLTYADQRGRPFVELLARVGATTPDLAPAAVLDLGCGPGNLTELLARRWPDATVRGLDSSAEMVAAARERGGPVDYETGDLRDWAERAEEQVDVLLTNATLQWLPGHLELLPRLVARVRPGGWFAMQVPGNTGEPSHELRRELAAEAPYAAHTAGVSSPASHDAVAYLDALVAAGCVDVDAWETTYVHVLTGEDPVFTWVSGTGARPTLQALPDALRPDFEAELRRRLARAYPRRADGSVLLPFRRVFAVARVPEARR
ncbi:methyltransferase domain-containing protein [Nocardioides sp. Leaf307]|uniref:methyltransferase domain-containing protein n=1 Tax=Nocardioides sp. Leaf307 TaxID=1736331 RepID=UPI001F1FACB4|nr:methyltransferase domain-containing protein [Nocardioides sp. Leaf307]